MYYDHSRQVAHVNSPHNFGGTGIFLKSTLLSDFDVTHDKSYDGIQVLKLKHKHSSMCLVIINAYLPPVNSVYGRNATEFMSHLLTNIYLHANCDAIYLVGDLNSRVGKMKDYIPNIDNISDRNVIDHVVNTHGEAFIDFLIESNMVILNGRISCEFDNFTRIHTTGSSVVDYVCTFFDNLTNCESFKVNSVRHLMDQLILQSDKIPDHSILELDFHMNYCKNEVQNDLTLNESSSFSISQSEETYRYLKCNNGRNLPVNFMDSELANQALNLCIGQIQTARALQSDVDKVYDKFCNIYYAEIDKWFKGNFSNKSMRKRFRNTSKPYWNENLTCLWKGLCKAEKQYLSTPQHFRKRRELLKDFKLKQNNFDTAFKKAKRAFERGKMINIEKLNTDDPKAFWAELKKLGPRKKDTIPMEVYDENGLVKSSWPSVISKWNGEFQNLFNGYDRSEFDNDYYTYAQQMREQLENNTPNDVINTPITADEVKRAVKKAKSKKAVGIDNLPYEILKNPQSLTLMVELFNKIFSYKIIPSLWRKTIIKPIPKNSSIDPRVPLQYRGIALLSTTYKLYSSILNNRIMTFCESRNLLHEEQNGFRRNRSCSDHVFVVNSIIRNRLNQNKSTFAAFLDAEKAFDRVDRSLLFFKLIQLGINGAIYDNIKSIYQETQCCLKLNNTLTNWFRSESGVLQGDTLSPTLFNIFINDLIPSVKSLNKGVPIGDQNLSILLYADDIIILSENASDLQSMLDSVYNWSFKNMIRFNEKKSNVVHFRRKRTPLSSYDFHLGTSGLKTLSEYKYLGIVLDEYLDYSVTTKTLANAANRALGAIINKFKKINGLGYYTYTRMFHSGVCPILDYCSETWGFKDFASINSVQNKAIRIFLGVHRFAPIAAITGDFGWTHSMIRRQIAMLRMWNRIVQMGDGRLPKIILKWDISLDGQNWSFDLKKILGDVQQSHVFENLSPVNLVMSWSLLHEKYCIKWKEDLANKPKLRTYRLFKENYQVEPYVTSFMNRKTRSCISQLRCGILPLAIETGRWTGTALEFRYCKLCNSENIEDEMHFIFHCNFYSVQRDDFSNIAKNVYNDFDTIDDNTKLVYCMSQSLINSFSKYLCNIFKFRQRCLYC